MKVEAIRTKDGFLIPMTNVFKNIEQDRVLLEVEIIEPVPTDGYSVLDQLVGLCKTSRTDAARNHDAIIYSRDNVE